MFAINIVGLNSAVKGPCGPTTAIFQSSAIVAMGLSAVYSGLIPSIEQILGSILAIFGVLLIIFRY